MESTGNNPERSLQWHRERIELLAGFALPERVRTMREVLSRRTRYMTVCMENTFYPHNASALVRHCDAFGIQDIHTVEQVCRFNPSENVARGTDKWLTFHRHADPAGVVADLHGRGYRIVATTPHAGDDTPEDFDVAAGPFALVFGTELDGVSPQIVDSADSFLRIPMEGFVESLNVSASAAILLYMLSSRVRQSVSGWELGAEEQEKILFGWLKRTVRSSSRILERYEAEKS